MSNAYKRTKRINYHGQSQLSQKNGLTDPWKHASQAMSTLLALIAESGANLYFSLYLVAREREDHVTLL